MHHQAKIYTLVIFIDKCKNMYTQTYPYMHPKQVRTCIYCKYTSMHTRKHTARSVHTHNNARAHVFTTFVSVSIRVSKVPSASCQTTRFNNVDFLASSNVETKISPVKISCDRPCDQVHFPVSVLDCLFSFGTLILNELCSCKKQRNAKL